MIQLKCVVTNIGSVVHPKPILRKFYQTVFWEDSLRSFTIYTAVILGSKGPDSKRCQLTSNFEIGLSFQSINNNVIIRPRLFDISHVFMQEKGPWDRVWGKAGASVLTEAEFCAHFRRLQDVQVIAADVPPENSGFPASKPIYYVSDEARPEHRTLAVEAKTSDGSVNDRSFGYTINGEPASFCKGVEVVNWTRASFSLSPGQHPRELAYEIQFGDPDHQRFFAPDFTLYFILPYGYSHILTSTESFREIAAKRTDSDPTALVLSPPDPSVYFTEWKRRGISNRSVLKLKSQMVTDPAALEEMRLVSVRFTIESKRLEWSTQLTVGVFLSILFAFGADSGRIAEVKRFFPLDKLVPPDIFWLFVAAAILGTVFLPQASDMRSHNERRLIRFLLLVGWSLIGIWFLIAFWWVPIAKFPDTSFMFRLLVSVAPMLAVTGFAAAAYVVLHFLLRHIILSWVSAAVNLAAAAVQSMRSKF